MYVYLGGGEGGIFNTYVLSVLALFMLFCSERGSSYIKQHRYEYLLWRDDAAAVHIPWYYIRMYILHEDMENPSYARSKYISHTAC